MNQKLKEVLIAFLIILLIGIITWVLTSWYMHVKYNQESKIHSDIKYVFTIDCSEESNCYWTNGNGTWNPMNKNEDKAAITSTDGRINRE